LTVPFSAHESTLETIKPGLSGQILIDTTVPLRPPKVTAAQLPAAGSAAQMTRDYLADNARVVAAFHNISAKLLNKDTEIDCDILVTSDDPEARKEVLQLVGDAGCHGLDAGALANSAAAEALTSVLIHLNKTYKVGHAGIVITGLGN
jgi:NADPH-dependent F420 reductase